MAVVQQGTPAAAAATVIIIMFIVLYSFLQLSAPEEEEEEEECRRARPADARLLLVHPPRPTLVAGIKSVVVVAFLLDSWDHL